MTGAALGEYAAALRERYLAAGKKEKAEGCPSGWAVPRGVRRCTPYWMAKVIVAVATSWTSDAWPSA